MASNDKNVAKDALKVSPTASVKSDETQKPANGDKGNENLSDDENLSGFDSDSEDESGHNGE